MRKAFKIELAGETIEIHTSFDYTERLCTDYLSEKPADFVIRISPEDIERERIFMSEAEISTKRTPVAYSDAYFETLAVYRKASDALLERNILLFHGSALAIDGKGYIFTALSGTGKSTHARLWREKFGDRVVMVNDDKPLLRVTEDSVYVCGTPWNGKHRLSTNTCVPVKAICILERDQTNHITSITPRDALPTIVQQSFRPEKTEKLARALQMMVAITNKVELYRLGCNMEPEAAEVAYNGMRGTQNEA